ncbi:hypothetical protein D3C81_1354950 [compost metagenome]
MAIGEPGFETEPAGAEEAAGLVVDVLYAFRRLGVLLQGLAVGAGGAGRRGFAGRGHQALGLRWAGRLVLDLTHALFEDHQCLLLGFVALLQFEQLTLEGLHLVRRRRGDEGWREECGHTDGQA